MKRKHITLISLNFYPEQTAIGLYSTQLAQFLEEQGAQVTVITAFPYYPQWEINKEYKKYPSFYEERLGSIRILRYKQYTPKNPSFLKRIFHIIDFTLGTWQNLKKVRECDKVISVIPFTSSAWLGNKLSRKHHADHWIHIQDFEFDAAFQSGLSGQRENKRLLQRTLQKLETSILNKAAIVSTISRNMIKKLEAKTTSPTYYLPNWVEPKPQTVNKSHQLLQSNRFTILYSGNIGEKQDWTFFIELLEYLDFELFEVIVVGDGAKKEWLQAQLNPYSISIHKPVPYEELHNLLASADLHILLQKTSVLDTVMPSKVLGMMASGKPSFVSGHPKAEVGEILKESNGGYYFGENDVQTLILKLMELKDDKQLALAMGTSAKKYVLSHFSKKSILKGFLSKQNSL